MKPFDQQYQGGMIPRYPSIGGVPGNLTTPGFGDPAQTIQFRYGGVLTYEKPIVELPGDIVIPVGSNILLLAGRDPGIPRNTVQVRFINMIGTGVICSFNGYPFRTILAGDSLTNVEIRSLQIVTDALSSVIVQVAGTGD